MRKSICLLCACLILAFGILSVQASAEDETPAWVTAYEQLLTEWNAQIPEEPGDFDVVPEISYLVYDVDKDGIPELIAKIGTCEADYHGALYTFRDGKAFQVGEELGLGHASLYSDPGENGIILMWGHMGFASAVRISIADGYTEEPLYEDDLNARLEEDPDADYIYPGDVIPGSVYLTMCRGGLTLPLTHYDEIRRILEGEKPAVTGRTVSEPGPCLFENLINGSGEVYAVTADGFTNSPGRIGFQDLLPEGRRGKLDAGRSQHPVRRPGGPERRRSAGILDRRERRQQRGQDHPPRAGRHRLRLSAELHRRL